MSFKRYAIFALVSVFLHGLLVQAMEQQDITLAMSPAEPGPISVKMLPKVTTAPPVAEPVVEPTPEPIVEPKPEPKPAPKPEPKPQPKPEPKPTPKPEPKPQPKPAPKPAPQPDPAPKPAPQPTPEPPAKVEPKAPPAQAKDSTPKRIDTPSIVSHHPPSYPRQARRRGQEGTVIIEVWLDERGRQTKHILASSSGVSALDKAALQAITKWKFSAYVENGQGIAHRVHIPIRFKLD